MTGSTVINGIRKRYFIFQNRQGRDGKKSDGCNNDEFDSRIKNAREIENPYHRALALNQIACEMTVAGCDRNKIADTFKEALETAKIVKLKLYYYFHMEVLPKIIEGMCKAGLFDEASEAVNTLADEDYKKRIGQIILDEKAKTTPEALAMAKKTEDAQNRAKMTQETLSEICPPITPGSSEKRAPYCDINAFIKVIENAEPEELADIFFAIAEQSQWLFAYHDLVHRMPGLFEYAASNPSLKAKIISAIDLLKNKPIYFLMFLNGMLQGNPVVLLYQEKEESFARVKNATSEDIFDMLIHAWRSLNVEPQLSIKRFKINGEEKDIVNFDYFDPPAATEKIPWEIKTEHKLYVGYSEVFYTFKDPQNRTKALELIKAEALAFYNKPIEELSPRQAVALSVRLASKMMDYNLGGDYPKSFEDLIVRGQADGICFYYSKISVGFFDLIKAECPQLVNVYLQSVSDEGHAWLLISNVTADGVLYSMVDGTENGTAFVHNENSINAFGRRLCVDGVSCKDIMISLGLTTKIQIDGEEEYYLVNNLIASWDTLYELRLLKGVPAAYKEYLGLLQSISKAKTASDETKLSIETGLLGLQECLGKDKRLKYLYMMLLWKTAVVFKEDVKDAEIAEKYFTLMVNKFFPESPLKGNALLALAQIALERGDLKQADKYTDQIIEEGWRGIEAEVYVLKGRISDNKDDKKAAYNYYKRALEFDPTNKDAEAGTVLIDLEELPK